jgi:CBS domain-containing protein
MELKDIMTTDVETVTINTPLQEAAEIMKKYDVGSLPVLDKDTLVGIITDRDIVLRGVAGGNANLTCREAMTSDIVSGTPDMDAREAARIMAYRQIRRLPVVDNGKLIGIVALGDIATEPNLTNEAGDALNDISKPIGPVS